MHRYPINPILTRDDIPGISRNLEDVTSVFNPGAIKIGEKYVLILRVQARSRETYLIAAESLDGINFTARNSTVYFAGIERVKERIYHMYDARITRLEDAYYVMFAMDMDSGCQLGLARTTDMNDFDFMGIVSDGDIRNGVLFPEKVNGKYLRMDRPNKARHTGWSKFRDIHLAFRIR